MKQGIKLHIDNLTQPGRDSLAQSFCTHLPALLDVWLHHINARWPEQDGHTLGDTCTETDLNRSRWTRLLALFVHLRLQLDNTKTG